jgi:predicted DCC family thiol-disulfide oxidoreductase YuxK
MEPPDDRPLVLFDGVCNLCSFTVQFLAPRDRDSVLWFASVQSRAGAAAMRAHGLSAENPESFVFIHDGHAYQRSEAFFRLLPFMTRPWALLRVFAVVPRAVTDWVYDRIARNRYALFGRKEVCMIPRPDLAARFLA